MPDRDGHPTEKEIEKIKNWEHEDGFDKLLEYVLTVWWCLGIRRRGNIWRLATGGWSGNEEIIHALKQNNLFWMTCWNSSHRGGLHKFYVPPVGQHKCPPGERPTHPTAGRSRNCGHATSWLACKLCDYVCCVDCATKHTCNPSATRKG